MSSPEPQSSSRASSDVAKKVETPNSTATDNDFYVRYYVGHKGKFGHEFLEFELQGNGRLRYANNSNYKSDSLIRKEAFVSPLVVQTIKLLIEDSRILEDCDDNEWPEPSEKGSQELEVMSGREHISFTTSKIGKLKEVSESKDPDGLRKFYFLVQDLKGYIFSLMSLHFRLNPVQRF